MISTRAIRSITNNGVERNRPVCKHAQAVGRCRTRRVHSRVHTGAPTRRAPFASIENTTRCGIGVPVANFFQTSSHAVIISFGWLGLSVGVKFSLWFRVSGMIRVTVDVRVMVRVSNLLGSD